MEQDPATDVQLLLVKVGALQMRLDALARAYEKVAAENEQLRAALAEHVMPKVAGDAGATPGGDQ